MIRPFLLATLTIGAAAADAKPAAPAPMTPIGKPEQCISIARIDRTEVRDDRTIDFVMRTGETYRSTLPAACPQLGFFKAFSYGTSLPQLCSTDIINVIVQGSPVRGASCGLAPFQKIAAARRR